MPSGSPVLFAPQHSTARAAHTFVFHFFFLFFPPIAIRRRDRIAAIVHFPSPHLSRLSPSPVSPPACACPLLLPYCALLSQDELMPCAVVICEGGSAVPRGAAFMLARKYLRDIRAISSLSLISISISISLHLPGVARLRPRRPSPLPALIRLCLHAVPAAMLREHCGTRTPLRA